MSIIIKSNVLIGKNEKLANLPESLEYDFLKKNITDVNRTYVKDIRMENIKKENVDNEEENVATTLMMIPGTKDINFVDDQRDTIPRPQGGPSRFSNSWIGM